MTDEELFLLHEREAIMLESNVPDAYNKAVADQERQKVKQEKLFAVA